jgi:hypothetical protein
MPSVTESLYRLARLSATARAISRGRAGRRAKDIALGRALARLGSRRKLWG